MTTENETPEAADETPGPVEVASFQAFDPPTPPAPKPKRKYRKRKPVPGSKRKIAPEPEPEIPMSIDDAVDKGLTLLKELKSTGVSTVARRVFAGFQGFIDGASGKNERK
jgi:hypothetical protein